MTTVMCRLLTGYTVSFNRRHRRYGHLFQNRFKSILCQENIYLKELVSYIHLNSFRARRVTEFKDLARYPYGGHSVLMGKLQRDFQDADYVLGKFGDKVGEARRNYREYIRKRVRLGGRPELVGGGLLRSSEGWGVIKAMSKARIHLKRDERILGDSDFVLHVPKEQNERMEQRFPLREQGYDFEKVIEQVSELFSLSKQDIIKPSRQRHRIMARSVYATGRSVSWV